MDGYPRSNIRRRKRGREGDERSREIKRKTRNLSGVSKIVSRSRNVVAFQPSLFRISRRCSPESCEFLSTCQVFRVSELRGRSMVHSLGRIQVRKKFPLFATFARFTATVSLEILFPFLPSFVSTLVNYRIGRAVKRNLTIYVASEPCFS